MRKLLLIATLALATAAWAQTAGMQDEQLQSSEFQHGQAVSQQGDDWYQAHLNRYTDQFVRVNNGVSPTIAGIVDQQDQFYGAQPGAMALNPGEGQEAMAANAGGEDSWYDRKVQADATLNSRALAAIRSNPDMNSADAQ